FEVKHDVSKPFVISSGNVNVEVLGTTFYVNTERADGKLEVILNSGKVAVYFSETPGNRVILTPGEKAEVSRDTRKIEKDVNDDPNWLSWKTGRLVFNNTPLGEIAQDLMRVYPVKIELTSPGISRCLVTATFENQSLESVLNVLKATLNVKITISGTTIMISGDACR
ncbi:MAG TPA: FecR domain-containing protein, partial [Bacteroidales bacterium]|nr:FecR domain-containing protein [Bacteroidales bacterium]